MERLLRMEMKNGSSIFQMNWRKFTEFCGLLRKVRLLMTVYRFREVITLLRGFCLFENAENERSIVNCINYHSLELRIVSSILIITNQIISKYGMAQAYPEPREQSGVQLISEKYRYSCKRQERQSIAVDISPALC